MRHERGPVVGKVSCEQFVKLRRVDICETVGRCLYGARFGEVARKALSVVGLFLAGVWHVSGDVDQPNDGWIISGFGDYGASVAVRDKNARSVLKSKDALCGNHIILKGCLRLLNDADVVAILDKNVVHASPARTIRPGAVNQNNIPNATLFVLRGEHAAGQQQQNDAQGLRDSYYHLQRLHRITHFDSPFVTL